MSKTIDVLEYLRKYPIFDAVILNNKLNTSNKYINLYLHRLKNDKKIFKIEKNKYTLYKDPFLIASRIVWPSYISCWSAVKYHNLTEQIPHDIWVITTKYKKDIIFDNVTIRFIKTKKSNFFGYNKIKYSNFEILMADSEKAIIDSALLRKVSFSEIKEIVLNNIKAFKTNKFLHYLKKINNKSLIKRFGYLFELLGKDYYGRLRRYIDAVYIPLDYSKRKEGKRNDKWKLIIND